MRVKTCTRCGESKPLDQFPPRRRGQARRQSWCRACFAANNARYYIEHREVQKARLRANTQRRRDTNRRKAAAYLSTHPCIDCGESDLVVLDFDHIHAKRSAVSALITNGASWERIEAEINNCVVRCANCHRIRTAEDWLARESERSESLNEHANTVGSRPQQSRLPVAREPRICRVCGQTKAMSEFPFRSLTRQTRQWICLACQRIYTRSWYERNCARHIDTARRNSARRRERAAAEVRAARERLACLDCGESNPLLLDFHHLRDKIAGVSAMVRMGLPWHRIDAELAKCEPLCANCHRRRTAKEQGWLKGIAS